MIDREKLRADMAAVSGDCRVLKSVLSETWTRPMADEQRRLARLRWRATELCVLAASLRGRVHAQKVRDVDVDDVAAWHARIVERVTKDYACPEAEGALL